MKFISFNRQRAISQIQLKYFPKDKGNTSFIGWNHVYNKFNFDQEKMQYLLNY